MQKARQSAGASAVVGQSEGCKLRCMQLVILVSVVAVSLGVMFGLNAKKNSSPSPSQAPTGRPSHSPSSPPSSSAVIEFMDGLPAYSIELAESYPNSPQAKALAWLQDDSLYNEYELHRLYQRYALAVLYHSTNGPLWDGNWEWLSNDNECDWYTYSSDDICDESFRLHILDLGVNGLDGAIPAELELLTDLKDMTLIDYLSGEIPSAM
jgi:hypothetical protein